ncbi:MAG: phytoene desaturase [Myxococcota bacterium]
MAHAVVIGSGFGGLAAALRLRARGYEVTVVEAMDQPGGRAAVFERDGFTFDAGPTLVTAPYLFSELFELFGKRPTDYYDLVPIDPFYRVLFNDGTEFDYVGDEERLLAQIAKISPSDVEGYKRFAAHARKIFDLGYTELADKPFTNLKDMLKILPAMLKLQSQRSVYAAAASFIKDERLLQALTFEPLLVGGNPFTVSSIYLLIHWVEREWGVHFAMGGTTSLVKSLCTLMAEEGVNLRLSTPVEQVIVENGKTLGVVTESGERILADIVVSNADPSIVYGRMIDARHRKTHKDWKLNLKRQSMSLFVSYFGTKKKYPELAHHTLVMGPRYKGLLDDVFKHKILADDFSLYLHCPTRTDPSLAPDGCEAFYVLSPVPNNESGIDWEKERDAYQDKIFAELERRCLPGLRENLVTAFNVTPDYFQNQLRSASGAAFGPEPVLWQSAYFRYHNVSEDVKGLYFVGAGTHPGGGMPGVLNTARVLDRVVPAP